MRTWRWLFVAAALVLLSSCGRARFRLGEFDEQTPGAEQLDAWAHSCERGVARNCIRWLEIVRASLIAPQRLPNDLRPVAKAHLARARDVGVAVDIASTFPFSQPACDPNESWSCDAAHDRAVVRQADRLFFRKLVEDILLWREDPDLERGWTWARESCAEYHDVHSCNRVRLALDLRHTACPETWRIRPRCDESTQGGTSRREPPLDPEPAERLCGSPDPPWSRLARQERGRACMRDWFKTMDAERGAQMLVESCELGWPPACARMLELVIASTGRSDPLFASYEPLPEDPPDAYAAYRPLVSRARAAVADWGWPEMRGIGLNDPEVRDALAKLPRLTEQVFRVVEPDGARFVWIAYANCTHLGLGASCGRLAQFIDAVGDPTCEPLDQETVCDAPAESAAE